MSRVRMGGLEETQAALLQQQPRDLQQHELSPELLSVGGSAGWHLFGQFRTIQQNPSTSVLLVLPDSGRMRSVAESRTGPGLPRGATLARQHARFGIVNKAEGLDALRALQDAGGQDVALRPILRTLPPIREA